ncbi:hypothetical protein GCM10022403_055890 [Streptomyces coacervatus]|uniref:Uncharacterized protein n=1 Tax=Streptomyces coacervatus TaxID=647381 RepID=A0ABP7ICV7_9ACTN
MNDLGWGRPGGSGGNKGSGGGQGPGGGSVRMAYEDGAYVGNGSGAEYSRKPSGGGNRGVR